MASYRAGAHRLWSHQAYKARTSLKMFLAFTNVICFQKGVFDLARDHRVHLCTKDPDVKAKVKGVDISTHLADDQIVWFQHTHLLDLLLAFSLPLVILVSFWNETWLNSLCIAVMLRWTCSLNAYPQVIADIKLVKENFRNFRRKRDAFVWHFYLGVCMSMYARFCCC